MNATMPMVKSSFGGYVPFWATMGATMPRLKSTFGGYIPVWATMAATMPRLKSTFEAQFEVIVLSATRAVVLNIETMSIVEYVNYPFNSFAADDMGNILAAADDGLYLLGGLDDDGAPIAASLSTALSDFGTSNLKSIEDVIADFEGTGIRVTTIADGEVAMASQVGNVSLAPGVHTERLKPGRGIKSRTLGLDIENIDGGPLALKDIELRLAILPRKV
jgi:hypothetical protein